MEKIFYEDFREELFSCLKDSGMQDNQIWSIIDKRYKVALKNAVIGRLNAVMKAIKENNLEEIDEFIDFSSSGDFYGSENHYISFSDITDCEDIGDVINALRK